MTDGADDGRRAARDLPGTSAVRASPRTSPPSRRRSRAISAPSNELLEAMAAHVVNSGGKRLRPLLVILCRPPLRLHRRRPSSCSATSSSTCTPRPCSTTTSSTMRRCDAASPSANRVWGNHLAVLGGDFLYTTAFDLLLSAAPREVIRVLCRCSLDMIDGEVLQRRWRNRPDISEETYLAIVARKTASLISGCCRTGALLAGADPSRVEALGRFGSSLGTAFQVIDDTLDYLADPARLGKALGGDLRQGTVTLPADPPAAPRGPRRGTGADPGPHRARRGRRRRHRRDRRAAARAPLRGERDGPRPRIRGRRPPRASNRCAARELHAALTAAADFVINRDCRPITRGRRGGPGALTLRILAPACASLRRVGDTMRLRARSSLPCRTHRTLPRPGKRCVTISVPSRAAQRCHQFLPNPGTCLRSSTERNGPCAAR